MGWHLHAQDLASRDAVQWFSEDVGYLHGTYCPPDITPTRGSRIPDSLFQSHWNGKLSIRSSYFLFCKPKSLVIAANAIPVRKVCLAWLLTKLNIGATLEPDR